MLVSLVNKKKKTLEMNNSRTFPKTIKTTTKLFSLFQEMHYP